MLLKAIKFARKNNFRFAIKKKSWDGYKVYEPIMYFTKIVYIGHPQLILINKKREVRWATFEEVNEILFNDKNII